jgi:hypothetical protein
MAHVTKATLLGSNPVHAGDSPGGGANSKFMSHGEGAEAQYFNRAFAALADNIDNILAIGNFKSMVVCDASGDDTGDDQDCDYSGATALQDAITAASNGTIIFVRAGTYSGPTGAAWNITQDDLTIVGEGGRGTSPAVRIQIDSGYTIDFQGDGVHIESVQFEADTPATSMDVIFSGTNVSMKRCTIDTHRLYTNAENVSIEDVTISPYDSGLLIGSASLNCHIKNVVITAPTAPLSTDYSVSIANTSDKTVLENVYALYNTTDMYGLRIGDGAYGFTLKNCYFHIQDGKALYTVGGFEEGRFENCDFRCADGTCFEINGIIHRASFDNCYFTSNQRVLDTGATALDLGFTFENCQLKNTASAWHSYQPIRVMGARNPEESSTGYAPYFKNCVFFDRYSKGADIANAPGTTGTPSSTFPVFQLEGCRAENITFDRTGISWVIFDGEWISLHACIIDGLKVIMGTGNLTPFLYDDPSSANGLINIYASKISNILIGDRFGWATQTGGRTSWDQPLIFAAGKNYTSTSVDQLYGKTVLDGVFINSETAGANRWIVEDAAYKALALHCANDVMVKNLVWSEDNILGYMGAYSNDVGIVTLGDRCIFYTGEFSLSESTTTVGIPCFITLIGDGVVIRDSRLYITPLASPYFDALIGSIGSVYGTVIDGCHMVWNNAVIATSYFVDNATQYAGLRLTNCYLYSGSTSGNNTFLNLHDDSRAILVGNHFQASSGNPPGFVGGLDAKPATFSELNTAIAAGTPAIFE